MKADDNDKLWELLGKTRQPAVSPFFARNVLRAVRQEKEARLPLFSRVVRWFRRRAWQSAFAGTCAVAIMAAVIPSVSPRHRHIIDAQARVSSQIAANPDYEVINHLDELVADEESSLWLDDSVH